MKSGHASGMLEGRGCWFHPMHKLAVRLAAVALLALASPRAWAVMTKATTRPAAKPNAGQTKAARTKPSKTKAPKNAPVVLYHVNRRETMALRLRDGHGRPVKGMQKRFDHFLRCHHTNAQHKMDPRLMRLLYTTGHHYPGRRIEVVSGYRHPSVAKNPHSPHMQGLACDFRVEGIKTAELRDYLRKTYDKVGVGYYPNSSFVHLDVRKDRSAFWIDYSGPGERSMYSETPDQDLRSGRADRYHPTKIDNAWTEEGTKDGTGDGTGAAPPPDDKDQGTP
jgi:uncharacterized protein YcbK (DUF882 family)